MTGLPPLDGSDGVHEPCVGRTSRPRRGTRRRFRTGAWLWLLGLALVVSNLPGASAIALPVGTAAGGQTSCFLDAAGTACPTVPAPAALVPPQTMTGLQPAARDALQAFSDQAIASVLTRYGLPESDRAAVLGYARYDALAELWGLIVQSFETPKAQRTARQQAVVDWLGRRVGHLRAVAPPYAAIEYAKFAGKNVNQLEQLLDNGGSEQQIKDFLTGTPEPYDQAGQAAATGGYCRYRPPAPYASEFDGHLLQACYTPCLNIFGCAPTTPDYSQFVKWGNVNAPGLFDAQSVANQSALIAGATVATGAAGGVASGVALYAAGSTIFPFATAAATLTVFSVAAIVTVPAIILAAVAIAAVAGINVATIDQMPGKLAGAIAQSRQPVDADTVWPTADGKSTLYSLFVDAVSPAPRQDITCDNGRVEDFWQSYADGTPVRVFTAEVDQTVSFQPCLNPPAIPAATALDPFFQVTAQGGQTTESPSITVAHPDLSSTTNLRLGGDNWFVAQRPGGAETKALHVNLTDWQGRTNTVWLERTAQGYLFHGVRAAADGSFDVDPRNCTTCFTSTELQYVGPDGVRRTARVGLYQAPTGTPSYTAGPLLVDAPITFSANGFAPGGAVGNVTYTWRFQKDDCGDFGCFRVEGPAFEYRPVYLDPEPGAVATHSWAGAGGFYARVEATDAAGHTAAREFIVSVRTGAPTVILAIDCALSPVPVACNNYPTTAGNESILFGGIKRYGLRDRFGVRIDWGDGSGDYTAGGSGGLAVFGSPITLTVQSDDRTYALNAHHTYARPGYYNVTVAAKNQVGDADIRSLVLTIRGKQQVSLPQPADQHYGGALDLAATGTQSGLPITYTAGPAETCRLDGTNASRVLSVGVGACTVTANQAGGGAIWLAADPVSRTFNVLPAPLTITAQDATRRYGAPDPVFTATYDGLLNGDTSAVVSGLGFDAAPAGSGVGSYPLVPKGATSPNYQITFSSGRESITPAPLTIKADDTTTKYGVAARYTWNGTGFVNGDDVSSIDTAPTCRATVQGAVASVTSAPGRYPGAITCSGAADADYTVDYGAAATLTINPVIALGQTGLPATLPRKASIDGQVRDLPTGAVEVAYGTTHAYAFPAVVTDANGVPYMTRTDGFSGPVAANVSVTASYTTMTALLATEVSSGGTDQKTATNLATLWNDVQAGLKSGTVKRTGGALDTFVSNVRAQSDKKISKATADTLIAYAGLVYASVGLTP